MNKKEKIIEPINASFDDVVDAVLQSKKPVEKKMPRAIKKGNFKEEFGIDVDCYVLDDENHTAVISKRGMGQVLALGEGGDRLTRFVKGKLMSKVVAGNLMEKIDNPLIFKYEVAAENKSYITVHGYDVTILLDVCNVIIDADRIRSFTSERHQEVVKQAYTITRASQNLGLTHLVYALAGYDVAKEEVIRSFKVFVAEAAREYEREFPEELYTQWYRLYELEKPERNRPWKFKHLTEQQVYKPLAKSNGKILELTKVLRENAGNKNKRLHQFLSNDVGAKALRHHLGQLTGIAKISKDKKEYEKNLSALFGEDVIDV